MIYLNTNILIIVTLFCKILFMKKTKIIATISDLNCSVEFIRSLYNKGVNIIRLNTAHQDHNDALKVIENVRAVSDKIAILLDTKGPEIRTNKMEDVEVKSGDVIFVKGEKDVEGNRDLLRVSYEGFVNDVKVGSKILIDDGVLELRVEERVDDKLKCIVVNNGVLQGRKSVNIPSAMIKLPSLTTKDINFIKFAAEQDLDFVAHSFVRRKADVEAVQKVLDECNSDIKIIAKIENEEGVENIDEILDKAYGIMVARGDLAIEISQEKIPSVQKGIIEKCNKRGKPVIVATQMLHSMIKNPRPTRAEVSDIANAMHDGADAIMLSGETAYGEYPEESVEVMHKIALEVEPKLATKLDYKVDMNLSNIAHNIVKYAVDASTMDETDAIIADTTSGQTVLALSAYRPINTIFAQCYNKKTMRHLALSRGVYADYMKPKKRHSEFVNEALERLEKEVGVREDETFIIVAGSFGRKSGTTFMEISEVKNLKSKYR